MTTILAFIIALLVLVIIHELGHFFAAKLFSVRVDEFGIGYPPRARKLFRWKGTDFTLNWLPFGGFVKIFGEEDEDASRAKHAFSHQKLYKRLIIVAAGVVANMVLAILLYAISFSVGFLGSPDEFPGHATSPVQVIVTEVVPGSPADGMGLKSGDVLDQLVSGRDSISPTASSEVTSFVHSHGTALLGVVAHRGDEVLHLSANPKILTDGGKPSIGVNISEAAHIKLPFFTAIGAAVTYAFYEFIAIWKALIAIVGGIFGLSHAPVMSVSGPVGIAKIAGTAFTLGLSSFLAFMAVVSINLAVINLLPFPALDGGRFILELFSKEGKSKIPRRVVSAINQAGFIILIVLMVYVTYRDIARLVV